MSKLERLSDEIANLVDRQQPPATDSTDPEDVDYAATVALLCALTVALDHGKVQDLVTVVHNHFMTEDPDIQQTARSHGLEHATSKLLPASHVKGGWK